MNKIYQVYQVSDSTGETLDRIFLALKAQFKNIEYKVHSYSFTRTENQILKILGDAKKNENSVILYTIVDNSLAKYLANKSDEKKIPCFGVLGKLILNFSVSKVSPIFKLVIISVERILLSKILNMNKLKPK